MLSLWLHRIAFLPVLLAIVVAAFSFTERPRPIGTTLAPDAFSGARAVTALDELEAAGDEVAAVARTRLRAAGFAAALTTGRGGQQVVGERTGRDERRLLVVAHLPARADGRAPTRAELSGAAALLELARVFEGRATRRTLTLALVRDDGRGRSALRDLARRFGDGSGEAVGAVLVLGDLLGAAGGRAVVVPWAETGGAAPLRLRRTVEEAVRIEAGLPPAGTRARGQLVRYATPVTLGAQGPFGAAGLPAVLVSAAGEQPSGPVPARREARQQRLQGLGRAALRAISALDNGPSVPPGPRRELVVARQVVPDWTVRLIAGTLVFPLVLAAVDGFARVRRRRHAVLPWVPWLLGAALPFVLAAAFARVLGLVGLLPAPGGPVGPDVAPVEAAGLVAVALALALGFLLRPLIARVAGASGTEAGERPGAACAVALTLALLGVVLWAVNPFTAIVLAPTLHLWLLAAAPEVRSRVAGLALAAAGALPLVAVALFYATRFAVGPVELAWLGVLGLTGGGAGPLGVLATAALLGCGTAAVVIAARKRVDGPDAAPTAGRRSGLAPAGRPYAVLEPAAPR